MSINPMHSTELPAWHSQVHAYLENVADSLASCIATTFSPFSALGATKGRVGQIGHLALASISTRIHPKRGKPRGIVEKKPHNEVVGSLAASPSEVKARLAGVPIYAVRA